VECGPEGREKVAARGGSLGGWVDFRACAKAIKEEIYPLFESSECEVWMEGVVEMSDAGA
jgi:hypothetical protein